MESPGIDGNWCTSSKSVRGMIPHASSGADTLARLATTSGVSRSLLDTELDDDEGRMLRSF